MKKRWLNADDYSVISPVASVEDSKAAMAEQSFAYPHG